MEKRLSKLEAAWPPVELRQMCIAAAEANGLDADEVLAEAQAILTRCAGLSLADIAAREGVDLAELEATLKEGD